MTVANARFVVSAGENRIEIVGSELFVAEQLTRLKAVIGHVMSSENTRDTVYTGPKAVSRDDQPVSPFGKYAGLYASRQGRIRILKNVPGETMANKTLNVALLIAHASVLMDASDVPLGAIRAACKDQGCHDTNNFSSIIKRGKNLLAHDGWSQISLTEDGMEEAVKLANRLLAEDRHRAEFVKPDVKAPVALHAVPVARA